DGSTDNTAEVIRSMQQEDERIRYIYEEHAERSAARNNGADHALGRDLLFLDSDDSDAPEHLEGLHRFIEGMKEPVALLFSKLKYDTDQGQIKADVPVMQPGLEFNYLLRYPLTPSRVCVHREIFTEFRFDPEIVIVEDQVLWICI